MAIPDYQTHIDGLRAAYAAARPWQRAEIARQRMADPMLDTNQLITCVSAVEALARSLAVEASVKGGEKPEDAYTALRFKNAEELLEQVVAPAHGTTMDALVGPDNWTEFKWAVQYRNLLIHEGASLREGYTIRLLAATRSVFSAIDKWWCGREAEMNLKRASSVTRGWIDWLRTELSGLGFTDTPVWADFRDSATGDVIAHLRPSKSRVICYLKLDLADDPDLAPAHTGWDFPSTYTIGGPSDLPKAKNLIQESHGRYLAERA